MQHRWRTAPVAGALALVCAVLATAFLAGPAVAAGELETRTITSYDVDAAGGVHVTLLAQIVNRDPSTQRRDAGLVFYYSTTAFAVHEGAANVVARTGTTRLATESAADARQSGDPFRLVVVRFGRNLHYNESIEITLEYNLAAVRGEQVLVSRDYAFVTAIAQGTQSLVRITAPAGRQVTVGSPNCTRTAERPLTYLCGASTVASDYQPGGRCAFGAAAPRWECAFTGSDFVAIPFEATSADLALATWTSRVQLARTQVEVKIQHFAGDEAWAARVDDLIRRGLPLLEEANGFPYPGLPVIEVVESGYRDTHGYEGLANTQGRIRVTPVVDDQTVLHEMSHLWSGIFASRWLAEGMADYTANVAARRLGLRAATGSGALQPATPLEDWGPLRSQIAVTRQERELEEAGYNRSLYFLELLAVRLGPRALASANATLAQERIAGTARSYLDALEQVSAQPLAPLFAEWALRPEDVAKLPARAAARAAAAEVTAQAVAAGLAAPNDIQLALIAWEFGRAQELAGTARAALSQHRETLERARAAGYDLGQQFGVVFADDVVGAAALAGEEARALAAVQAADARLVGDRTPLMRVGLAGSGLDTTAAEARGALARGDFRSAIERADAVEKRLDGAARDGAIRIALATGVLALAAGGLLVRGRFRMRPRRDLNVLDSAR